ncbi:MAG: acyl-CoA dehydrogenase family protein, partial [Actinobacteria bacterium]|nr:acyl-CoA dehydrogenase family protein [Actinomycetota bacterium]
MDLLAVQHADHWVYAGTGLRDGDTFVLSGSKKPCSLAHSMDLLTASVAVDGDLAVAIVRTEAGGIERRPFWRSWVLRGAESDEVVLDRVAVEEELLYRIGPHGGE